MADSFDYAAAKAAGMTPAAIQQFLDDQLQQGHAYDLPASAFGELRAVRLAQGGGGSSYRGAPDQPLIQPHFYQDPVELASLVANPFSGPAVKGTGVAIGAGASAARAAAVKGMQSGGGALARGAGGALLEGALEHLPGGPAARMAARGLMAMFGRGGQAVAGKAEATAAETIAKELGVPVEQVAEHLAQPLVGAEGQLFRTGGMPAVIRERIAQAAEAAFPHQAAVPIAEAAAAPAVEAAAKEAPQGMVKVAEHFRGAPKPKGKVIELPPSVQKRIATVAKTAARRGKNLAQKAGRKAAAGQDLSALLKQSVDLGAELEKRGIQGAQRTEAYRLIREMNQ